VEERRGGTTLAHHAAPSTDKPFRGTTRDPDAPVRLHADHTSFSTGADADMRVSRRPRGAVRGSLPGRKGGTGRRQLANQVGASFAHVHMPLRVDRYIGDVG